MLHIGIVVTLPSPNDHWEKLQLTPVALLFQGINGLRKWKELCSNLQKEVQLIFVYLSANFYVPPADVNDNVPFFTSSIYEASVTEGAESGVLVLQVSSTDLDLGLNGKVKEPLQNALKWNSSMIVQVH